MIIAVLLSAPESRSQTQTQPQTKTEPAAPQSPQQGPVEAGPAAGGPNGNLGAITVPKKKQSVEQSAPAAPPPPQFKNPPGMAPYSLQLQVPEVVVNVGVVLDKSGQFVSGLKPDNFRVFENGVPQKIIGFRRIQAPITALLLCEFSAYDYWPNFRFDMLNAAWSFAQQLRPQDYVALMTFDLNPHIILDFTQNKSRLQEALNMLENEAWSPAAFQEVDLFDALYNAMDRLSRIHGQKYIILIASGLDTFSKTDFDQIYKRVKESRDITIFTIVTGGLTQTMMEGQPGLNASMQTMNYLQGDNEMHAFAAATGGMSFVPRFWGELPDDVAAINASIRSKYQIVYEPTDKKQDGTYRKLHVELVNAEGKPLRMQDKKHHPLKYKLIYRSGYRAKPEVE